MTQNLVKASLKSLISFLTICLLIANCEDKDIAALGLINSLRGSSSASNQKPDIPDGLSTSINDTVTITLTWNAGKDFDGTIVDYEVSRDNGVTWISSKKALSYTFTGLTLGTTYNLQVKAKDNQNAYSDVAKISRSLRFVKKVTLGEYHSFIETTDNKLFAFGSNFVGQLGLGKSISFIDIPVEVTQFRNKVKKVTLGFMHSFIETTDNKLFAFGANFVGQLGLGASPDSNKCATKTDFGNYCHTPVELAIAGKVKKVTLGTNFSFIETTNKLFAFGYNGDGELGLGRYISTQNIPVEVTRFGNKVKQVTLGGYHSFIETTDDELFVFGRNGFGQLGLGDHSSLESSKCRTNSSDNKKYCHTPVKFTDTRIVGKVKRITLGYYHSFIETTNDKLFVFGRNDFGQLGLGNPTNRNSPVELTDPRIVGKVKKVTLGGYHSFIETTDGKLFVFGRNDSGQLGLGDTTRRTLPVELTNSNIAGKVKQVTLGGEYSFIETTDGKLFAFGRNDSEQLGLGPVPDVYNPTKCDNSYSCHTPVELVLP